MNRIAATVTTSLAVLSVSSTAWACPPSSSALALWGLVLAPFLAIPYALLATGYLATRARAWFERPFGGWVVSSFGAWLVASVGGAVGFGAAHLLDQGGVGGDELAVAVVLSTPLVFECAYLTYVRHRARKTLA